MINKTSMISILRRPAVLATVAALVVIVVVVLWPEPGTGVPDTKRVNESDRMSMPADPHAGHDGHSAMQSPATYSENTHPLEQSADVWSCSMHPHIQRDGPGQCPICGMELIVVRQEPSFMDDNEPRRLSISSNQRARMRIATVPVERRYPTAEVRLVGKVTYDETRLAYITAWVPGRIDDLFVDYTGVKVQKGDHMVKLYSPELLSAQEELLQSLRGLADLSKSNVASLRRSAAGTVEAARDKLRLSGLGSEQITEIERSGKTSEHVTIFSPTSGVVIHRNAQEGMYVDIGTRIFTVADLEAVWVQLDAYESDLQWLRYGQTVNFTTEAYAGERFSGVVSFIDPVLDPQTRTVKVRVNVANKEGRLKPEMFVRAEVLVQLASEGRIFDQNLAGKWVSPMHPEIIKDAPGQCDICGMDLVPAESLGYVTLSSGAAVAPLVIPATAALLTGTRAVVYVEQPGTDRPTYIGREVVLGPRAGDSYIVKSGLAEGELVVVSGNFKIDSALQIQAKPSMMNPEGGGTGGGHDHGGQ
jgi:Cu(I)/Ag(I) efflux system membrane fusion protein